MMLSLSYRVVVVLGLAVWLPASAPRAMAEQGKAPAATQAAASPSDADIAKAIEQLNAERFADRQAASQKLEAAGKLAISALEKAALGDSLEVTTRSIELLAKFGKSSDEPTRDAAIAALDRLARSDRPAASGAQEALKTLQPAPGQGMPVGTAGAIQIQGAQIGGAMTRISVSNVNGVKNIEVDENGKKVKIADDPQNGIKMEVTTQKDGKDVTEKYQAKNADELKEKFPEAHKLYKQYSQGGNMGMIRIQAGNGIQIVGGPVRIQPVPVPAGTVDQGDGAVSAEVAALMMKRLAGQLQALSKGDQLRGASASERDNLKKQAEQLKRQISDLEKQLEKSARPETEKK